VSAPNPASHVPQDIEAERNVLGAVLLASVAGPVDVLRGDIGLRPEHFYRPRHGLIWAAIATLADAGKPVDLATVWDLLERPGERRADTEQVEKSYLFSLPSFVPHAGHYAEYGRKVVELADLRRVRSIAVELLDAVGRLDRERVADLEGRLASREHRHQWASVEERQEALMNHLDRQSRSGTWRWPFSVLDELFGGDPWADPPMGGMWPGDLTVLIGHPRHGKSALCDQALERVVSQGGSCCVYFTEGSSLKRDLRHIARTADIPMRRLLRRQLDVDETGRYADRLQRLPFELRNVGDMTFPDIVRDIRRNRWDACAIDLLNHVSGRDVAEIDDNVSLLARTAADLGTHVIACQHLNRAGNTGQYDPRPTLGMIRGSGGIGNTATNVLSVWREPDDTGRRPGDQAIVEVLKAKDGIEGELGCVWNGGRMRFELTPGVTEQAAA
jgi:replicative DNA helicase